MSWWSDRRVGPALGSAGVLVLLIIAGMAVYVTKEAWPSFSANGLAWFGSGGDANVQLAEIFRSAPPFEYTLRAWPLVYGTALAAGGAVVAGLVLSILAALYIVAFAPPSITRILEPVVRLLAGVPSVIYGLIGVLVLVPFVNDHLISTERKESVFYVIQLTGQSLLIATALLTIMIVPIMISIAVDALRSVPSSWTEGALALGANRMRVMWTIGLRASRPALVAGAVLALARALGEAIMLAMVSGGVIFSPNLLDGPTFFFEPIQPFAAAIVQGAEGITVKPFGSTLFAFAAVIMVSSVGLSITGSVVRRRLRKFAA
ncbi:ABC transporter permease subunit [Solirubrobacter phytolaccae]|uniref:ABC transporter permease subunit n=1 Tax=Solirubrobacter phytolaccae TaxID=1404360 RepID=A0A9X3NEX4_9ACTN|nr:ABC transporter permease subunit [Solirubrobacter phytolaccae]MDA0184771.1 ABC transporter permease subunit [Solirubrobacter phytolaccae]